MKNEIMNILLESKMEKLKKEVNCIKITEDIQCELLKHKPKMMNEQIVTERIKKLPRICDKIIKLQREAIAYCNHDVIKECWKLDRQLEKILDNYRKLIK